MENKLITIKKITEIVLEHEALSYAFISERNKKGKLSRRREVLIPRQLTYYFAKKYTNFSLEGIGSQWNQDHATVLHAIKTINELMETDVYYRDKVKQIQTEIELYLDIDKFKWEYDTFEIFNNCYYNNIFIGFVRPSAIEGAYFTKCLLEDLGISETEAEAMQKVQDRFIERLEVFNK